MVIIATFQRSKTSLQIFIPSQFHHSIFFPVSKSPDRVWHKMECRKELLGQNLAEGIPDLELRAQVSTGVEAATVSCLLCGRLPLRHRPQPSKLHLGIQGQGAHLCPCHRKQGWGTAWSAEGRGASSAPSCPLHGSLPMPSHAELGQHGPPPGQRSQASEQQALHSSLPLADLPPPATALSALLTGSCPSPRGLQKKPRGLICPFTQVPAETESQRHSLHLALGASSQHSPH